MFRVIQPPPGVRRVPILIWARRVPPDALRQLQHIAEQPYVVEHVAAMPDLHVAHHLSVGTVFATEKVIVPSALGGDLGCGMTALRFDFPAAALSIAALERVLRRFGDQIPVGDAVHRGRGVVVPEALLSRPLSTRALEATRERLLPRHLGTLGGGNHFVELDRDGGGDLWLLVHSGSRGLGAAVAAHHLRSAEEQGEGALPALAMDTDEGRNCVADLEWALDVARANREQITSSAVQVLADECGAHPVQSSRVDIHHNFAAEELHFGRPLWIHRKGAIRASPGERALIPGSMATASYLVEGLGEPLSFSSGSHGAGRVLTRGEARRTIRPREFVESMRRVVFDPRRSRALVEESPAAYRNIREVLEDEEELVRPILRLEPIAVLKG